MRDKLNKLKHRIRDRIPILSSSQKRIADFIAENPRRFALCSIRELENELKTSKSTIVRFSKSLGYEGFQDLKSEFIDRMRQDLSPIARYKIALAQSSEKPDYFSRIADQAVSNINATLHILDNDQYQKVIGMLRTAGQIHTLGLGISMYLAQIASYLLNLISINSVCMPFGGMTFAEQIINLNEDDVLLAFSFPPYSVETVEAAAYAKEKDIKVIAVTDKVTADIVPYAEAYLQVSVETQYFSNCINAVMVLLSAITAQLSHEMKEKTLDAIESIEHVRRAHQRRKARSVGSEFSA